MKKLKAVSLTAIFMAAILALTACGSNKKTPDDAREYVKACLDSTYKGDADKYAELTNSSKKEAEEMYEQAIDTTMEAANLTEDNISDELLAKYRQFFKDVYKKLNYTVGEAKEDGDGGFTVVVEVKPILLFQGMQEKLNQEIQDEVNSGKVKVTQDNMYEYVYGKMYDMAIEAMDEGLEYGDATSVTVHVTKNSDGDYEFLESDMRAVDQALVAQPEIQ